MDHDFNHHYERMHQHGEIYTDQLDKIPKEKTFDGGHRYGYMTMNLVKCVNFVLKRACNLPIPALVRATYFRLAQLFATKGREAYVRKAAGNVFFEVITTRLRENQQATRGIRITAFTRLHESFHVQELSNRLKFKVDLRQRYCDYGDFQIEHQVIAYCSSQNIDWLVYVDDVYRMDTICKVYAWAFEIVGHESTQP